MSKNALIQIIDNATQNPDIPILGKATLRLTELDEHNSTIPQIVEIVLSDPSLSQKILRTAQSVPFLKWGGGSSNNTHHLLTSAVMALGLNQIKSIAIALNIMASAHNTHLNSQEISYYLFKSLCAAFAAKEIASLKNLNSEENAIRALFFNAAPIFCLLYHEPTFRSIEQLMSKDQIDFDTAFKQITGASTFFLIERLMKSWGLPDYLRAPFLQNNTPEKELIIKTASISTSFMEETEKEFLKNLNAQFQQEWNQYKTVMLQGLDKGKQLAIYCGLQSSKKTKPSLDAKSSLTQSESDINLSTYSHSKSDPIIYDIAILCSQIASNITQANDNPVAHRALICNTILEKMRGIFEMEWGFCAFGHTPQKLQIVAFQGATINWAQNFVSNRQKNKMDIFLHSITNGVDIYMESTKNIKTPLPPELAPEQFESQSFVFLPLTFKNKVKGYVLLSSGAHSPRISDPQYAMMKHLCAQLTIALHTLSPST